MTTGEATEASTPDLREFDEFVKTQGPKCTYPRKVAPLTLEDTAKLNAAMASSYDHRTIARWINAKLKATLGDKGMDYITEHVVARHRNGECQCPRP